jgi:hypothetical protein
VCILHDKQTGTVLTTFKVLLLLLLTFEVLLLLPSVPDTRPRESLRA